MAEFIMKRVRSALIILLGITLGVFFLIQMQPGNPYAYMIDPNLSKEMTVEMFKKLGYYDPIYIKYFKWILNLLHGNMGYSIRFGGSVSDLILEKIGNTAILGGFSFIVSSFCGIFLGITLTNRHGLKVDYLIEGISFILISIPTFFYALVFIKLFSLNYRLFPSSGMISLGSNKAGLVYFWDIAQHMILPGLVLGIGQFIIVTKYTKINMMEIMKKEYMKAARMKGLSRNKVVFRHGLKNIILPIITVLSLQLPIFLSGSLITETIFVWPGIGRLNYEAVINKDYPLIMGILLFTAILILVTNFITDILYVVIDKRIEY